MHPALVAGSAGSHPQLACRRAAAIPTAARAPPTADSVVLYEPACALGGKKRELVGAVLSEDVGGAKRLTKGDLEELFRFDGRRRARGEHGRRRKSPRRGLAHGASSARVPSLAATVVVNVTFASTLLAPVVTLASVRLARKRRYLAHRRLQITLLSVCWLTVLALETLLRLSGGSGAFSSGAPAAWQHVVRPLLLAHIGGAVTTYALWTWLAVVSWRRFGRVLPGVFSRVHRRAGWIVFAGLVFTSLSATGVYALVFLAR